MSCPRCKHEQCVKNGKVEGKQRYKRPSCGFQFTRRTPRGYPPWLRALSVYLYCHGLSMNAIAKMLHASPSTILIGSDDLSVRLLSFQKVWKW